MAFCFGRQFRRIAAEAITCDREEMRALIERMLPPRDDGARLLRLETEADYKRAPAVIVAAFLDDALTGDEGADLLRKTEDPAFRWQAQNESSDYGRYGPIVLTPGWRNPVTGLPYSPPTRGIDYPLWGPPLSSVQDGAEMSRCNATNETVALVNNNENTSEPCCDAEDRVPERPP
jgi:hypothetical protein